MINVFRLGGWASAGAALWFGSTSLALLAIGGVIVAHPKEAWRAAGVVMRLLVRSWRWYRAWRQPAPTTFGAARWIDLGEAAQAKLTGDNGLILGRLGHALLRHPSNEANMIVFAPQGAGKGVGVVIPNLLEHSGSIICIDPKGENFAVTAEDRMKRGPVWLLSMESGGATHQFNPMDCVRGEGGELVASAARLAELMMPEESKGHDHWRRKAVQWLTGIIVYVAVRFADKPERRTLGKVHELVTLPTSVFADFIAVMARSEERCVREVAASMARSLETDEGIGILSTIEKGTEIYSLGRTSGEVCARSDFALDDLFGERPASLYLRVPLGEMGVYAGWLRVMIGLANRASLNQVEVPDHRPLFVLDEASTLGEIRELQETIGQGRAYHQKLFIYQDMAQLKASNRGWASVLANCQIHMAFAVNDLDTADMLSRRLGDKTITTRSFGVSTGADAVLAHHQNVGEGEHGRRLLLPQEVLTLKPDEAVVTIQGLGLTGALKVNRLTYYREAMFAGRFGSWRGSGRDRAAARVFARLLESEPVRLLGYEPMASRRLAVVPEHGSC